MAPTRPSMKRYQHTAVALPETCENLSGIAADERQSIQEMSLRQRKRLFVSLGKKGEAEQLHKILQEAPSMSCDFELEKTLALEAALARRHVDAIDVLLHHKTDLEKVLTKHILKCLKDNSQELKLRKTVLKNYMVAGFDLNAHIEDLVLPMFRDYSEYSSSSPATDMLTLMFEHGLDHNQLKRACLNNGKKYHVKTVDNYYKAYCQEKNRETVYLEVEEQTGTETAKPQECEAQKAEQETSNPWVKIDENSIAYIEEIEQTETSFQTIFNFKARNVKTLAQIGDSQPTMEIQSFRQLDDTDFLQEAFNTLSKLGGKPKPYETMLQETPKQQNVTHLTLPAIKQGQGGLK